MIAHTHALTVVHKNEFGCRPNYVSALGCHCHRARDLIAFAKQRKFPRARLSLGAARPNFIMMGCTVHSDPGARLQPNGW